MHQLNVPFSEISNSYQVCLILPVFFFGLVYTSSIYVFIYIFEIISVRKGLRGTGSFSFGSIKNISGVYMFVAFFFFLPRSYISNTVFHLQIILMEHFLHTFVCNLLLLTTHY